MTQHGTYLLMWLLSLSSTRMWAPWGWGFCLLYFLLCPQSPESCLTHSSYSMNISWVNVCISTIIFSFMLGTQEVIYKCWSFSPLPVSPSCRSHFHLLQEALLGLTTSTGSPVALGSYSPRAKFSTDLLSPPFTHLPSCWVNIHLVPQPSHLACVLYQDLGIRTSPERNPCPHPTPSQMHSCSWTDHGDFPRCWGPHGQMPPDISLPRPSGCRAAGLQSHQDHSHPPCVIPTSNTFPSPHRLPPPNSSCFIISIYKKKLSCLNHFPY